MKKGIWIISVVLVMICIFILPFQLTNDQQKTISVSMGLISGISSLITLVIAFLLFDKYGLKKGFIKAQTEIVLSQLEAIKTANFLILDKDNSFLQFYPIENRLDSYERYYSEKLIFNKKYWEYTNQVFRFSSSIYMPKEIASKIGKLKPSLMEHISASEVDYYSKVTFWGENEKDSIYGRVNGEDITFQEFYTNWLAILDEINKWLKDKISMDALNVES